MKKRSAHAGTRFMLSLVAVLLLLPILITVLYSFFSPEEIRSYMSTRNNYAENALMEIRLAPKQASLMQYYLVLITDQSILHYFVNSALYTAAIIVGQLIVLLLFGVLFFLQQRAANEING